MVDGREGMTQGTEGEEEVEAGLELEWRLRVCLLSSRELAF